jgi:hypothetical protein
MIKCITHDLTPDQSFRDVIFNGLLSAIECEGDSDKIGEGVRRFCNIVRGLIIRLQLPSVIYLMSKLLRFYLTPVEGRGNRTPMAMTMSMGWEGVVDVDVGGHYAAYVDRIGIFEIYK